MSHSSELPNKRREKYYDKDVDFDDLAKRDKEWASTCVVAKREKWMNFQDPRILLQLTRSLLKCDFNITSLEIPSDRLCPPVPVRWNYVRWLQELLDTTADNYADQYDNEREVLGLDVGVGASAIYPMLACSSRARWRMVGTDIDRHSLEFAQKNIEANGLNQSIKLLLSDVDMPLVPLERMGIAELDFIMTNPPFYSSELEMQASYGAKQAAPSAVCTGSANEMICTGGDVGFVSRLITESLLLRDRVQWYSAMLGKLASLQQIVAKLKHHEITNFAVTCLQAGHKTNRWAIAWSFRDLRPTMDVVRHGRVALATTPPATAQTIAVPLMSGHWAGAKVNTTVAELDVLWQWDSQLLVGVLQAKENVWSRAARRKKKFGAARTVAQHEDDFADPTLKVAQEHFNDDAGAKFALAVKISCRDGEVEVRWLRGSDHVVFESFCGMLKRSVTTPSGEKY